MGNDAVVLYINSSRKVFNLKQIAFRETGNSLSVVNTQCNSHPGLSDLQITQLLIKSVSWISLYVFSLVHLHSSKVTKDWKGNCKAGKETLKTQWICATLKVKMLIKILKIMISESSKENSYICKPELKHAFNIRHLKNIQIDICLCVMIMQITNAHKRKDGLEWKMQPTVGERPKKTGGKEWKCEFWSL